MQRHNCEPGPPLPGHAMSNQDESEAICWKFSVRHWYREIRSRVSSLRWLSAHQGAALPRMTSPFTDTLTRYLMTWIMLKKKHRMPRTIVAPLVRLVRALRGLCGMPGRSYVKKHNRRVNGEAASVRFVECIGVFHESLKRIWQRVEHVLLSVHCPQWARPLEWRNALRRSVAERYTD